MAEDVVEQSMLMSVLICMLLSWLFTPVEVYPRVWRLVVIGPFEYVKMCLKTL